MWFDGQAEEAATFYCSVFKNSKIKERTYYTGEEPVGKKGAVMTVVFELNGQEFVALNGGPQFKFTEAVSFSVNCDTQEEIDYFWEKLTSGGGGEVQCGWLADKYGLSWQVVPTEHGEMGEGSGRISACDAHTNADEETRDRDAAKSVRREVTLRASNFRILRDCDRRRHRRRVRYHLRDNVLGISRCVGNARAAIGRKWSARRAGYQRRTSDGCARFGSSFLHRIFGCDDFLLGGESNPDTHASRISLRHSLRSRHLCGDESGGPAAFCVPAQGHVSTVGYNDGISRSHVPDWIADRTRGASFVKRENVSLPNEWLDNAAGRTRRLERANGRNLDDIFGIVVDQLQPIFRDVGWRKDVVLGKLGDE